MGNLNLTLRKTDGLEDPASTMGIFGVQPLVFGAHRDVIPPPTRRSGHVIRSLRLSESPASKPWLLVLIIGDYILPTYMGIVRSHCKGPYFQPPPGFSLEPLAGGDCYENGAATPRTVGLCLGPRPREENARSTDVFFPKESDPSSTRWAPGSSYKFGVKYSNVKWSLINCVTGGYIPPFLTARAHLVEREL